MSLAASALPIESPHAFLGVQHSLTGKLWRDRLDARGAARALAIVQRHQLPEMLARVKALLRRAEPPGETPCAGILSSTACSPAT